MQTTTAVLVTDADGNPAPQALNETVTEFEYNQSDSGAPWTQPIPPVLLTGVPASGSSIAADGALCANYTVAKTGYIVASVALTSGSAISALQITRNATAGTPFWAQQAALTGPYEAIFKWPVKSGDIFAARLITATTLGYAEFFFSVV